MAMRGSGVLEKSDAAALDHAAEFLRTVRACRASLAVGRGLASGFQEPNMPAIVTERLAAQILRSDFADGVGSQKLTRTLETVRGITNELS